MKFICLLFFYLYEIFISIQLIDSLTVVSSLKREVRFTEFELTSANKTVATIQKATFKQFYDKQTLFVHAIVHESISDLEVAFSVSKCKEHFIDCVNVVSYAIHNVCSKLKLLTQFSDDRTSNNNFFSCPLVGDYNFKNITLDAEKFGTIFSYPTEKWWENHYRFKILLFTEGKKQFARVNLSFYFIEFRSRNHQLKN